MYKKFHISNFRIGVITIHLYEAKEKPLSVIKKEIQVNFAFTISNCCIA